MHFVRTAQIVRQSAHFSSLKFLLKILTYKYCYWFNFSEINISGQSFIYSRSPPLYNQEKLTKNVVCKM